MRRSSIGTAQTLRSTDTSTPASRDSSPPFSSAWKKDPQLQHAFTQLLASDATLVALSARRGHIVPPSSIRRDTTWLIPFREDRTTAGEPGLTTVDHQLKGDLSKMFEHIPIKPHDVRHISAITDAWDRLSRFESVSLKFDEDFSSHVEELDDSRLSRLRQEYWNSTIDGSDKQFDCLLEVSWPETRAEAKELGIPMAKS